ncbi:MAG: N-acetylmuramic acid 6-phosphate etherase [Bacteroidales bacterium]|nr:N-acetylmuramic acid 6-phosphate etherase [Bacteroidales bacterium]
MRTTEQASHYDHLDRMSTREILQDINAEDRGVPLAVAGAIPAIEQLVDGIVERVSRGGRVFYLGAGTSGRLGIVDASEIPPTYGVKDLFIGLIAGGDSAIRTAVEGAEDQWDQGWEDLQPYHPCEADTLVGITASGGAPYVVGALRKAREMGMLTGVVTNNAQSLSTEAAKIAMVATVGPEFVTGSTRMKSGTSAKLILNMISTAVMIRLGHVQGNKMVDMQLTNQKLVDRGTRMIMERTGITDYEKAKRLLLQYGQVRLAVDAWLNRE